VHNEINVPCITIDWARDGLEYALERKDIVIIVDTLRFSSAVITAVAHGYTIIPAPDRIQGKIIAEKTNAKLANRSNESGLSISPGSFIQAAAAKEKKVILPSPNGASCATLVTQNDLAFIGCFLNARAIGEMVSDLAHAKEKNVTVIACGEQRSIKTGERVVYIPEEAFRVFAIEDYLAAGAIIAHTALQRSVEAEVSIRSFISSKDDLLQLLRGSFSGRYLVENDLGVDIEHAVQLNLYNVVPRIYGGDIVHIE